MLTKYWDWAKGTQSDVFITFRLNQEDGTPALRESPCFLQLKDAKAPRG